MSDVILFRVNLKKYLLGESEKPDPIMDAYSKNYRFHFLDISFKDVIPNLPDDKRYGAYLKLLTNEDLMKSAIAEDPDYFVTRSLSVISKLPKENMLDAFKEWMALPYALTAAKKTPRVFGLIFEKVIPAMKPHEALEAMEIFMKEDFAKKELESHPQQFSRLFSMAVAKHEMSETGENKLTGLFQSVSDVLRKPRLQPRHYDLEAMNNALEIAQENLKAAAVNARVTLSPAPSGN